MILSRSRALAILAAAPLAGCGRRLGSNTIKVGSKNFTEELILGELYAQTLEGNGFEVTRRTSFVFTLFPLMLVSRLLDRKADAASASDDVALEGRVTFPLLVNRLFDLVMRIDETLIRLGLPLPFGGTLVVVARKR